MICIHHQIPFTCSNKEKLYDSGMWSIRGWGEVQSGFWWESMRKEDQLEDLRVDGRKILKWFFKQWDGGINWTGLSHDRGRWPAVVNVVMNLPIPQNAGNFLTTEETIRFSTWTLLHEGLNLWNSCNVKARVVLWSHPLPQKLYWISSPVIDIHRPKASPENTLQTAAVTVFINTARH